MCMMLKNWNKFDVYRAFPSFAFNTQTVYLTLCINIV